MPSHSSHHNHSKDHLLCAGVITGVHGIKGSLKMKTFLADPASFMDYNPYYNEEGRPQYEIKTVTVQENGKLIVSMKGISDRTQAERLKGARLMLKRQDLPSLDSEEFYHTDLINLRVRNQQGENLGVIRGIHNFGAGDVLEVLELKDTQVVYIPFTKDAVPEINIEQGYIVINPEILRSLEARE